MSYSDLFYGRLSSRKTGSDRIICLKKAPKCVVLQEREDSEFTLDVSEGSLMAMNIYKKSFSSLYDQSRQSVIGNQYYRGKLSKSVRKKKRWVPSRPSIALSISNIMRDFYISPMDWSKQNIIGLSLQNQVVFIDPRTGRRSYLEDCSCSPTSLTFNEDGGKVAIGDFQGRIHVYDMDERKEISVFEACESRCLCSVWKDDVILTGDQDGMLVLTDQRQPGIVGQYSMNDEGLCGLKLSSDSRLATSGGDEMVKIWDLRDLTRSLTIYRQHRASVRALAWSPLDRNRIASGGGISDKTIRIWDTETGRTLSECDAGSQVCNLFWNREYNELFATHGFSQNSLSLYTGLRLDLITHIQKHDERVLFMAVSPDGTHVATVAPENPVCVWNMFPRFQDSCTNSIPSLR